ncbi:hypothetical protein ACWKWC_02465 [Geodermatophilus nigrescens]
MELIGRKERPRLLVIGEGEGTELGEHLSRLAPTVRFLAQASELADVRQLDWDAVVLWQQDAELEDHLFVLQFGGDYTAPYKITNATVALHLGGPTVSTEFFIPEEDLPDAIATLVRRDLVPTVQARQHNDTLRLRVFSRMLTSEPQDRIRILSTMQPFLMDADQRPIAGAYRRTRDGHSQWWRLPSYTPNAERWASAAFASWRDKNPEVFPAEAGWSQNEAWQTDAELRVAAEIARLSADRERLIARLDEQVAAAAQALTEARAQADAGERLLLTAQKDDLVAEVKATLEEFGFSVIDVDKAISQPGDRREDLRVVDPDAHDWIALSEVRGYGKGAQLNDLLRIGRFVARFLKEQQREPDATWYIVNHFVGSDPGSRPRPLQSNPDEVETFAEGGGLVVDTADLFRLRMSVRRGEQSPDNARRMLREARGRFVL